MAKIKQGTAVDFTWQKNWVFIGFLRLVDIAHSLFL